MDRSAAANDSHASTVFSASKILTVFQRIRSGFWGLRPRSYRPSFASSRRPCRTGF
jgi:hypothetical protein